MRVQSAILLAGMSAALVGCATTPPPTPVPAPTTQVTYRPATAAALAFDPPMALAGPMPDLTRDGRSLSAFVGYEDAVTTVSSVYQRDQIRDDRNGQFDRQAYTARTSITTR